MKKRITKIAIVLLAISFILGSALNISSAAPTIDQNKKGSLTLFKYEVANTSEYTTPGTGETETVTETDTTKPLQGVTFELYKVGNVDSIQTDATDPATYTPTGTPVTKTTDVNGKAEFTNLDLGRYYVVETDAPENVSQKTSIGKAPVRVFLARSLCLCISFLNYNDRDEHKIILKHTFAIGAKLP